MNEEALLGAAKELIAIESTADNPAAIHGAYEYMRDMVLASGKDITIEEFESNGKPSLLAYRGQQRPDKFHIIFNGHIDVVPGKPEQFKPYIEDGKLYGRGAYDMKAAAIILTQVFCEYVDTVPYTLGLQIVTDEEGTGRYGTQYQVEQGVRANFIICGECGQRPGTYEIANEAKGIAALELQFRGSSAHGAYPWRGDNPALKAADFVRRLQERYPTPDEVSNNTTVTVTSVSATSSATNQTPEIATVKLDSRYTPGDPHFRTEADVTALIATIDPTAEITKFLIFGAPMYSSPHNPLLLELKAAAEQVEGEPFSLVRRHGTSDGRFYTETGGQACEFGIAGEHQHADNEYVTLEAFHAYLETMRTFLQMTTETKSTQHTEAGSLESIGIET